MHRRAFASVSFVLASLGGAQAGAPGAAPPPVSAPAADAPHAAAFELPCTGYAAGLRGAGNFGAWIAKDSPFAGSYHLDEDVWLPAGTEVRSVADGVVRYSDWSRTWTDDRGRTHWNLGNVIVVEHALAPQQDGMTAVCSLYVHLGARRLVAAGDRVAAGQPLGRIGADRSEENGRYPAHLHFGLHRGPYVQIPPAWRRGLETEARTTGIAVGGGPPVRGEIELSLQSATTVLVKSRRDSASPDRADGDRASVLLSLLVGASEPDPKPADIMAWCAGYGDKLTVDEWLCPSRWIAAHRAPAK
jgi:murein DD-endopeptidase MepM/ murein hydrolase activator NlpD